MISETYNCSANYPNKNKMKLFCASFYVDQEDLQLQIHLNKGQFQDSVQLVKILHVTCTMFHHGMYVNDLQLFHMDLIPVHALLHSAEQLSEYQ